VRECLLFCLVYIIYALLLAERTEIDLDILDDLGGEAQEVNANNPWLTYGEPIHRIREFGMSLREFDLLDETALSDDQMVTILRYM
jgi:hypothetical protein